MSSNPHTKQGPAPVTARVVRGASLLLGAASIVYALCDPPMYGGAPGFGAAQVAFVGAGVGLMLLVVAPLAWNLRVLVLAVSGIAALALAEVVGERLLAPRIRSAFVSDPELIFKLAPGRTFESRLSTVNGGQKVIQRINSEGYRGPELLPNGSAFRVVVYGDSFIHASYSSLEDTFPFQLDLLLSERMGAEVEVINAGVSSYGPDQVLKRLAAELPRLEPDLVIVAVFAGNDYGDLLRNKMFAVGPDGSLAMNSWRLAPHLAVDFELNVRESILKRALREHLMGPPRAPDFLLAAEPLRALLEFGLAEAAREYDDYVVAGSDLVTNPQTDYFSADVCLDPELPSARYRIRLMDLVLREIDRTARQAGVPLAFLFIPHPLDACGEYLGGRVDRELYPRYAPENLTSPLEASARALGTTYLNLLDVFRRPGAQELYLRGGDDHWSAAGQRLAAERMAEVLVASGQLER